MVAPLTPILPLDTIGAEIIPEILIFPPVKRSERIRVVERLLDEKLLAEKF